MPDRSDLRGLREALAELARADVPELLAEARSEARARATSVLTELMTEALLEQARRDLRAGDRGARSVPAQDDGARGYYVYGVVEAADSRELPAAPGVDPDQPLTTVLAGELAAVVSAVRLAEFDEQPLREHLRDMDWVETVARRHEEVLETLAAGCSVLPMRLCSIYRDADGVRAMLARESAALRETLGRLSGRSEWGVKVFSVAAAADRGPSRPAAGPATGSEYLQQQSDSQRRRASSDEARGAACESLHARLSAISAAALALPLQRPEVTGHDGEMVFNGAYLVDNAAVAGFHEAVEALQHELEPRGIALHATGPWPAYNFVSDAIGVSA